MSVVMVPHVNSYPELLAPIWILVVKSVSLRPMGPCAVILEVMWNVTWLSIVME